MVPSKGDPWPASTLQPSSLPTLNADALAAPTPSPNPIHIAFIGAGISGLALAIGLLEYPHIKVTIYEAAPAFEEIGAGIGFSRNATNAMKLIDPRIYEGFLRIATGNSGSFSFYLGVKGGVRVSGGEKDIAEDELLGNLAADRRSEEGEGSDGLLDTVHRKDFLNVLANIVPAATVIFNKRLTHLQIDTSSYRTEMSFQDGTTACADAVIGCDGIHSVTRGFVLGHNSPYTKPVFSGKYCYRSLVDMVLAVEVLGERMKGRQLFLAKLGHVLTYPVEGGKTLNIVAMYTPASGMWEHSTSSRRVPKGDMLKDFKEHSGIVNKIVELMDEDPLQWALFDHAPAPTYFNGRVCLLGDAAHACTPHQGAGAGQALEDAYILAKLLGSCKTPASITNCFAAFDTVRRPRTQKVIATSRARGQLMSLEDAGTWDGERFNLGHIKESMVGRLGMGWIWNIDLRHELEKANAVFREKETEGL